MLTFSFSLAGVSKLVVAYLTLLLESLSVYTSESATNLNFNRIVCMVVLQNIAHVDTLPNTISQY